MNKHRKMKILCPNCSELVVPLDCETEEELREALKAVEQITGWKVCLQVGAFRKIDLIPIDVKDVVITKVRDAFGSYEDKEIFVREEIIPEKYLNVLTLKVVLADLNNRDIDPIDIDYTDGYCSRKCVLRAIQHCYEPHFEPLAKVCKHLNKKFHCHDGGDPNDFIEWLERNGYTGVEYERCEDEE